MRIGELAERTGSCVRSLRYYEARGLLASDRSQAGQRASAPDAVERVRLIRPLLAAGLGSRAIAALLPCSLTGHADATVLARLGRDRADLADRLAVLQETVARLDAVIRDAAASLDGGTCVAVG